MGRWRRGGLTLGAAVCALLGAPAAGWAAEPRPGWALDAVGHQYELASDVGMVNAPWVGTHNSYNSIAQTGVALSSNDANQSLTLREQLDAGIRSLELDIHRSPDVPGTTGPLRVCHGRGADQAHFGCTTEKLLAPTLDEIAAWLSEPGNGRQVLLLYLEDHMVDAAGYDAAAATVQAKLADALYAPRGDGCTELPDNLTRDDVRRAGAQVVIVSDCGPGTGWAEVAHSWNDHVESRPVDYQDYPDCGPDYDRATYDASLVRYYEDRTALTNQVGPPTGVATTDDGITPQTAAAMARCGVDLIGLDFFDGAEDPRLAGLVWSFAVNRPLPGAAERRCVLQRRDAPQAPFLGGGERPGWVDKPCKRRMPAACLGPEGWELLLTHQRRGKSRRMCEKLGLVLGTPRTGYEAQLLDDAMAFAGERRAWIGYKRSKAGAWRATDPR